MAKMTKDSEVLVHKCFGKMVSLGIQARRMKEKDPEKLRALAGEIAELATATRDALDASAGAAAILGRVDEAKARRAEPVSGALHQRRGESAAHPVEECLARGCHAERREHKVEIGFSVFWVETWPQAFRGTPGHAYRSRDGEVMGWSSGEVGGALERARLDLMACPPPKATKVPT